MSNSVYGEANLPECPRCESSKTVFVSREEEWDGAEEEEYYIISSYTCSHCDCEFHTKDVYIWATQIIEEDS